MDKEQGGVSQETDGGSAQETEVSAIADAIYAGFTEVAGAIREHAKAVSLVAKALQGDSEEPLEPQTYMDGSPK